MGVVEEQNYNCIDRATRGWYNGGVNWKKDQ